jgi:HPt (histidine-containing phosphotransfer) domain-containing protein
MEFPDHSRDIIDVADGIDRMMGDRRLYARVLLRFRRDYSGGAAAILAALDRGDLFEAQRLAHSLKGAAGMIGAVPLHRCATAAEHAIRGGALRMRDYAAALEPEFQKVYRLLDVLLDDMVACAGAPPTLLANPALVARLAELLLNGDGAATDLVEQSGASLAALLGEAAFALLSAAVDDYDYPRALQLLRGSLRRAATDA